MEEVRHESAMLKKKVPMKKTMARKDYAKGGSYTSSGNVLGSTDDIISKINNYRQSGSIDNFLNFLKHPALLLPNLELKKSSENNERL